MSNTNYKDNEPESYDNLREICGSSKSSDGNRVMEQEGTMLKQEYSGRNFSASVLQQNKSDCNGKSSKSNDSKVSTSSNNNELVFCNKVMV